MKEKRYKKIIIANEKEKMVEYSTKKGSIFKLSEGTNGELIITGIDIEVAPNVYYENYANPPIPKGYRHIGNETWETGFRIERISDGSQFTWIPVGYLNPDGTLNGKEFSERFGRRNYCKNHFDEYLYHENLNGELLLQFESVKKYGGFYISSYNISKSSEGRPQSLKGKMPWTNISFFEAKKIAERMENNETVKSHLTFGAEYDCILAWFIKSAERTIEEIKDDSTHWGNYENTNIDSPGRKERTGVNKLFCINNIFDFAGNVDEWTQEEARKTGSRIYTKRGGSCENVGFQYPVARRDCYYGSDSYPYTGFRVALCIK